MITKGVSIMGGKITEYGKVLRIIRMNSGELLKDMASKLDVTSSYLSAIENGKRNIPQEFTEKIIAIYNLDTKTKVDLELAETKSTDCIKLNLKNASAEQQDLAFAFAKRLKRLDKKAINEIKMYLK